MSSQRHPSAVWNLLRRHETGLVLAVVVVLVATAVLDSQHNYYYNPKASFVDLVRQTVMLGIFALGAGLVIIAGGIDLSSGSVIAFSGTICATIMLWMAPDAMLNNQPLGWHVIAAAIAGTLFVGFLIGSLHTWLITIVKLPPFVATLATLVGLRSLARAICASVTAAFPSGQSTQINIFDSTFRYLARSVWIPSLIFAVLALVTWLLLSRTVVGRHLYAMGGNEEAARLSGIRTDRLKWFAYCASAMLASVAGVLYIGDQSVADPQSLGRGYELNAIAAAVVGGCSLQGGIGTVPGIVLGAFFLRAIIDGVYKMIKSGADAYEGLVVGVVVVLAVALTQRSTGTTRTRFFAGGLGLVTIVVLSLLAGVVAAVMMTSNKTTSGVVAAVAALGLLSLRKSLEDQNARHRTGERHSSGERPA
jgi:ribose/xylose/arabinose/galactoside ABC-type transport system permease subunit